MKQNKIYMTKKIEKYKKKIGLHSKEWSMAISLHPIIKYHISEVEMMMMMISTFEFEIKFKLEFLER